MSSESSSSFSSDEDTDLPASLLTEVMNKVKFDSSESESDSSSESDSDSELALPRLTASQNTASQITASQNTASQITAIQDQPSTSKVSAKPEFLPESLPSQPSTSHAATNQPSVNKPIKPVHDKNEKKIECKKCFKLYSKHYISRHLKICKAK